MIKLQLIKPFKKCPNYNILEGNKLLLTKALKRKSDLITLPTFSQENSIVTTPIRNQPIKVPIEYTEEIKKIS